MHRTDLKKIPKMARHDCCTNARENFQNMRKYRCKVCANHFGAKKTDGANRNAVICSALLTIFWRICVDDSSQLFILVQMFLCANK